MRTMASGGTQAKGGRAPRRRSGPRRPTPAGTARAALDGWRRRSAMADPGGSRLAHALSLTSSIAASVLASWLFARRFDQIAITAVTPSSGGLPVAMVSHPVAMVIGGVVAMALYMSPLPPTPRAQLATLLPVPPVLLVGLGFGALVGGAEVASIVLLCGLATGVVLLKHLDPISHLGLPFLLSCFISIFIGLTWEQMPWVAALVLVSASSAIVVHFTAFFPRPPRTLDRCRQAFAFGAEQLVEAVVAHLDADDPESQAQAIRRLRVASSRLNEIALLIDAQLGQTGLGIDESEVDRLHRRVFDHEANLQALTRATAATAGLEPSPERGRLVRALLRYRFGDRRGALAEVEATVGALRHRVEEAIDRTRATAARAEYHLAIVLVELLSSPERQQEAEDGPAHTFRPTVSTMGGRLAGSGPASALLHPASALPGARRLQPLLVRRAVRVLIATSLATTLGYLISPTRWYWAFFAAFAVLSAANTETEHIRQAIDRALGTALGVAAGIVIAHALADDPVLSLAVIFGAIVVAFYWQRSSTMVNTFAMAIMIGQLYTQLGHYSDRVLLTRISETTLGAAVAMVVSLTVFRVRRSTVAATAAGTQMEALGLAVDNAIGHVTGLRPSTELRSDVRHVQDAHQQLRQIVLPASVPFRRRGPDQARQRLVLLAALTFDSANLARRAAASEPFDASHHDELERIRQDLAQGIGSVVATARDGTLPPPLAPSVELDDLDMAIRQQGSASSRRQLAVLHELALLQEHLIALVESVRKTGSP